MTSTSAGPEIDTRPDVPPFAVAGTILEALARRDFDGLVVALRNDVRLRALLPAGLEEWHGPAGVVTAFHGWFDAYEEYELLDAVVGEVGRRLHLCWRVRVRDDATAGRWLVVEQQVYAEADRDAPIHVLSLLCSGFSRETSGG